tara:strand:- start:53 stop:760 length:708 start_codon:yes stop_codon:yes gene_type:complete
LKLFTKKNVRNMKIIISEFQYSKLILEQSDSHLDTFYNKKFMSNNKPKLPSVDNDDMVDVISGVIDGVPGIGNLISAGIDIGHTISYCIRFFNTGESDVDKKIEYGTLAFITLGATFIPVAGNSLPIIAKTGIKSVLKQTPESILKIGKKLGLYNKTIVLLRKKPWKYGLLIVLCKIMGNELLERLTFVSQKLGGIYNVLKNYKIYSEPILNFKTMIDELISDVPLGLKLSGEIS